MCAGEITLSYVPLRYPYVLFLAVLGANYACGMHFGNMNFSLSINSEWLLTLYSSNSTSFHVPSPHALHFNALITLFGSSCSVEA